MEKRDTVSGSCSPEMKCGNGASGHPPIISFLNFSSIRKTWEPLRSCFWSCKEKEMWCKEWTRWLQRRIFQISSREPAVGSIVDGRPPAATPTSADIHSPLNILLLILVRESDSIFHVWLLAAFKPLLICFPFMPHILSEMRHTLSFGDGGRFTTCPGLSLSWPTP